MTTTATGLSVTPTAGRLGAAVRGIDLRDGLDDDRRAELGALLDEHLVLVLPDQDLDDEGQLAFALRFGAPYIHPLGRASASEPRCEHIVDDVDHPPYQDEWHTDVSWDVEPPTYGTLRAVDLPARGGDTIWSSAYAAYDALSPPLQAFVEPLAAVHTMGVGKAFVSKAGPELVAQVRELFPGVEHPVVAWHPGTGRPYLNVNRGFTESIVGLHPEESRAVLGILFAAAEDPNHQFRHHWSPGDVVIWDERCTQHFAVADYMPERREMGRVAVR
ncbi:MAG: TauD/TfdA family dioxygenase [Acidimicrobiales bacterium]|jgi:taurine dioxygenase|nr:TauD/TfdA family dioxygenase [Acidimicrobiales bacterium]